MYVRVPAVRQGRRGDRQVPSLSMYSCRYNSTGIEVRSQHAEERGDSPDRHPYRGRFAWRRRSCRVTVYYGVTCYGGTRSRSHGIRPARNQHGSRQGKKRRQLLLHRRSVRRWIRVPMCLRRNLLLLRGQRQVREGKGSDGLDHGLGRRLWPPGKRRSFGDPCTTLLPALSHSLSFNAVAALKPPLA